MNYFKELSSLSFKLRFDGLRSSLYDFIPSKIGLAIFILDDSLQFLNSNLADKPNNRNCFT